MNIIEQIEVDRSQEDVFYWMFQPQHIVQLFVLDETKYSLDETKHSLDEMRTYSSPWSEEQMAWHKRWQQQAEQIIEIANLSTSMLKAGTTFQYTVGVKSRSEEFPPWRVFARGTVTITKSILFRFFSFRTTGKGTGLECQLTFQGQENRTIITYHQSYRLFTRIFRKIVLTLLSLLPGGSKLRKAPFGRYYQLIAQHQLRQIKEKMEAGIQ